jgi:type II secretory pathway component PulJ
MADVPAESTSRPDAFVTNSELIEVLNEGIAELQDVVLEAYEDNYTVKGTLTTTASQEWSQIPDDMLRIRKLFLLDSGTRVQLERFDLNELNGTDSSDTSDRFRYRLLGNKLYWAPAPNGAYAIEAWYSKRITPLVDTQDTLPPEIEVSWERFLVAHLAAYTVAKQELDPSVALSVKAQAKDRIIRGAPGRDAGTQRTVIDVTGRYTQRRQFPIPKK